MSNGGIHKEHRKRMREKFKKSPHSMPDHELLEILLYHCIPVIDTNDKAHNLINLAGKSLGNVLELDETQIKTIDGLGSKTADYIMLLRELYNRIERERLTSKKVKKLTTQNIKNYLISEFLGLKKEQFLMICVDIDCNIINKHIVSVGSESSSVVSMKEVVKNAVTDKANFVFLAHNHPNGLLIPSDNDIELTKIVCEALALVEVPVIEHYIVTNKDCLGIIKGCGLFIEK